MNVLIRTATEGDYSALCKLFDEVDALHRRHLPGIFREPAGPVREQEYYRSLLADENVGLFIAEVNGEAAGFVHVIIRDTPAIPVLIPRRLAIVDSIDVRSELRHCGIGTALMQHAHQWAASKGATAMELNVYEFNEDAIRFYYSLGYKTLSRRMSCSLNTVGATV